MKQTIFLILLAILIGVEVKAQTDSIVRAKILDDGAQDAEKFYNKGIADFSAKNYTSALENFNEAIKLKATFERAFYNRGTTKIELNDFAGALLDFNTAISLTATAESFFGRAMVYMHDKNTGSALEDFSKAIELKQDYAQAYYYRGALKFETKDYKAAEADYSLAIQYKPGYAYAYNDRGSA